jgi:hypothetical protein
MTFATFSLTLTRVVDDVHDVVENLDDIVANVNELLAKPHERLDAGDDGGAVDGCNHLQRPAP